VNFHKKLSRIAEISTKVTGGVTFYVHPVHVSKLSRPNQLHIQTALTTVRILIFLRLRENDQKVF